MTKLSNYSRRKFLKVSALGTLGILPLLSNTTPIFSLNNNENLSVSIFSKHLQFLNYNNLAEAVKEMGFDGIDLTVRPKGHVLPENVDKDLPKATEAMKKYGLSPQMIVTQVGDSQNPIDKNILEVASKQNYKIYRTDWYRYAKEQDITESHQKYTDQIKHLALLNKKLGISGSYQNHSGHFWGSNLWELKQALEEIDPLYMGSQYDIVHATIEGGKNWEIGFRLIKDHINSLVIKDFKWDKINGKWQAVFTPLGQGMVDFDTYFSLLKKYNINVPVSIHCEYDLGGAEKGSKTPSMDQKEIFARIKKDLTFLRDKWKNAV